MCGIAGFVTLREGPGRADLERMTRAIAHRGPDDTGIYCQGPAFLGHLRLSIVDLAGGHQPLFNEDKTRAIVYNGEVFNHAAVRPELEAAGHRYETRSDTETILHGWEEWGVKTLDRFRGMFAFAIWDERRQTLVAARDRLGIKPFYYFFDGRSFVFASEIKALLEHPDVQAQPNEGRISEYLAMGFVNGEETLFAGIRKLAPGHWLECSVEGERLALRIERYWDVPDEAPDETKSESEWVETVRAGLEETVRLRLMADVPLGAFLSGGVDSSAIVALMQRLAPGKVRTFSVGYGEEQYSELGYARQVARQMDTVHEEVVMGREDFFGALPGLIYQEDEPIAWPSSVPLYFVSKRAARDVKVVLTGEGSDEIFGGYERYGWTRMNLAAGRVFGALAPGALRRGVANFVHSSGLLRAEARRKLSHTFLARENTIESMLLENFLHAFTPAEQRGMLLGSAGDVDAEYRKYWESRPRRSTLHRMLYADQKTYLVELLMKQDQMSMAASIESRVPFLDHHFLAMAMRIPDRYKIKGRVQKYILKRAVESLLPKEIIYRKKMGFPTPLKQWLREERAAEQLEMVTAPGNFLSRWIRPQPVRDLIAAHRAGRVDATDRIWRLLNLELWGRRFFGMA